MANIPEWFTAEAAEKVMEAAGDRIENQNDGEFLAKAYADFLNLAAVALERQERYPMDNALLRQLSDITGKKGNEILKLAQQEHKGN